MRLKDTGLTAQELKDMVNKYMVETYERYDFIAERAEGMYLYDEEGNAYLDFYGGVAVNSCGNRNPKVIAAIKDQLDDIMHTFNYPYTIPQALLAKKICDTIGMDKIFYQNSGTEANECMIKMARKYRVDKLDPDIYHKNTAKKRYFRTGKISLHYSKTWFPWKNLRSNVCNRPAGQCNSDGIQTNASWIRLCRI